MTDRLRALLAAGGVTVAVGAVVAAVAAAVALGVSGAVAGAPVASARAPETTLPSTTVDTGETPPPGATDSPVEPETTDERDEPTTTVRTGPTTTLVPPTVPLPSLPPIEDPNAESTRLVPVPAGCAVPDVEQAVFLGTLLTSDAVTARFVVGRVRSGSIDGFAVDGLIDVRYGDDVRYLERGTTYLVGAGIDDELGVLASTIRPAAPRFGGSEVASLDSDDVDCPVLEDPVRTLRLDGAAVESGVLTPITDARWRLLRAILQPVGVALLVLIGLASLKLLVFSVLRSSRTIGDRPPKDVATER